MHSSSSIFQIKRYRTRPAWTRSCTTSDAPNRRDEADQVPGQQDVNVGRLRASITKSGVPFSVRI